MNGNQKEQEGRKVRALRAKLGYAESQMKLIQGFAQGTSFERIAATDQDLYRAEWGAWKALAMVVKVRLRRALARESAGRENPAPRDGGAAKNRKNTTERPGRRGAAPESGVPQWKGRGR